MHDMIRLDALTLDAVVGITDAEQRSMQPLVIEIELGVDLDAASGGDLARSVDYAAVHEQVRTLVQYGHWRLIESLAVAIVRLMLAPPAPMERRAQVEDAAVTVRKPKVLEGAIPSVSVRRDASWCDLRTRLAPSKTWVDTLVVTEWAGAYRLHVEAGSTWEVPPGAAVHLIAGTLSADGRPVPVGGRLARGQARKLTAAGDGAATLLVVAIPPLRD
jgi:dihydroneopterin aldolase